MRAYVVGIGGSGARCIEALIHLCAIGLGPEELCVLFVDPDKANGSLDRVLELSRQYRSIQELFAGTNRQILFKTRLILRSPEVFTPFPASVTTPTFESHFDVPAIRAKHREDADLIDVLYTPEQQMANLNISFRGRPSNRSRSLWC